jgi:hypothetical protein
VAARQGAPVLGVLCGRPKDGKAPKKEKFELTIGYRYLPSHRHFVGTVEQKQRAVIGNEIVNKTNLFDFSLAYQVNPRISLVTSIPMIKSIRHQLYNPRGDYRVFSQGDATFGFRAWLIRPPSESRRNIGVGVSLKVPTGRFRVSAPALDAQGRQIIANADQSIQPGDGGTGFTVDLNAYTPTYFNSWLYFQSTYLFNPRNHNGVATFRNRIQERYFSVTDQYLVRGGVTRQIPGLRHVAFSIGGRWEGAPVRDVFGRSEGFRRPGYAISVEPGLMAGFGKYTTFLSVPIAVERNRRKSLSDYINRVHGDAAFADYSIILGISRRF